MKKLLILLLLSLGFVGTSYADDAEAKALAEFIEKNIYYDLPTDKAEELKRQAIENH